MTKARLLLLSNSRNAGSGYLEHARSAISDFLGPKVKTIAFIPYAAVRFSYDDYEAMVAGAIEGYEVSSIHRNADPVDSIHSADAIAVGGGNTFHLVHLLYESGLIQLIRERVADGVPFMGWSAGSNIACPTLRTTNDMPIIEPPSFRTLELIPFQINPHYLDAHPDGHMGETREERLLEYLEVNPAMPVVGLREGSWLRREGERLDLFGERTMRLMRQGRPAEEIEPGSDLSFLL